MTRCILIAGPTASGKSGLAVDLARRHNGIVINADSMQIYDVLNVLTARPSADDMANVEHLLFGHIHPSTPYSIAKWLHEASSAISSVEGKGMTPILVGGTGLYFKALLEGLSPVPEIDGEIRRHLRERSETDVGGLYSELQQLDPVSHGLLRPSDSQRIVRALEVVKSTGKTLPWWQERDTDTGFLAGKKPNKILLMPERLLLHERIEQRFKSMIDHGALEEVRQLIGLGIDENMPPMRAIGVRQLAGHIAGDLTIDEAIELSVIATRQYAKRQTTFFRHQFDGGWQIINSANEHVSTL
jgi:tRNA dimethylallyltransferase